MKVLQASLNKVERNTVIEVLRENKNRKIAIKRSEMKELTSYEIRRDNEERRDRIKQRLLLLEAEEEKRRKDLF